MPIRTQSGESVESCADPTVIRGRGEDAGFWYMYCTTDPLNDADRDESGEYRFRFIPMFRSRDLVQWRYMGDAFDSLPSWGNEAFGFLWAPEIAYFNGRYYLYYAITNTVPEVSGSPDWCEWDPAIGVATSASPLGPWTDHGSPVVAPRPVGSPEDCDFLATIDPEVIKTRGGERHIYYGSFYGGLEVRDLSPSGFGAPEESAEVVLLPERGEAPEVVRRGGYYYMFYSAATCCDSAMSGYLVMVGRSTSPKGPFLDRQGRSFLAPRVGGTPVLAANGNRWLAPGHNTVLRDFDGQWWTIYHAIDRADPHFQDRTFFTKRPALLDPLDWMAGWPDVRAGRWASDQPMPGPAAQPGETTRYEPAQPRDPELGTLIAGRSDDFDDGLASQWAWIRQPPEGTAEVVDGRLRFRTQNADLFEESNNASVLVQPAPDRDYVVETRMRLDLPRDGDVWFNQAGLVIYGNDDNYVKLVHLGIGPTRQIEFGKETSPRPRLYPPRFGTSRAGPPGLWTYLRIVRTSNGEREFYEAWSSSNGMDWVRGATWTHRLGAGARIGLVAMAGEGFTAHFDYVRVYRLRSGSALVPAPDGTPTVEYGPGPWAVDRGSIHGLANVRRTYYRQVER
ncbi:MAG: family 43 glycosylhydrolase [Chloroflexi bacterium]|nr:family 43 glycosylhydrolase [Chloroflexota bacterium]